MRSLSLTLKLRLKSFLNRLPFGDQLPALLAEEDLNSYSENLDLQPIPPCPLDQVIPVNSPPRYWQGGLHMLESGHPWLTPGAVQYLVNHLQRSFTVLEIGAGGSTVFFARRCQSVLSLESDEMWREAVTSELGKRGFNNAEIVLTTDQAAIEEFVRGRQDEGFDVILVDPKAGFDRGRLIRLCRPKLKPRGLMIVDNFAIVDSEVHLETKRLGWHSYYYVDPYWSGRGTSVHIKIPRA